jgi:ferredoxin-NADP reductase
MLTWRVVLPARAWFTHRMLVERVVPEGPGVVSVWVRGHALDQLGVQAGQFMLWRFLAPGHMWSAHPYSLSTAPDGRRLRITVKDAGDHSRDLARLRPGTPVLTEGPFGHFTADRRTNSKALLVAGGSGIGPVRALAEALLRSATGMARGSVVLVYRASRPADLVLRGELDDLAERYGMVVHYVVGRRTELRADPLGAKALLRLVPDLRTRDAYVCGPPGMTYTVLESLRTLGVPPRQMHAEEFTL